MFAHRERRSTTCSAGELTRAPSDDEFQAADLLQGGRLGGKPVSSTTNPSRATARRPPTPVSSRPPRSDGSPADGAAPVPGPRGGSLGRVGVP